MHLALLLPRIRLSPAAMPSTRSASASRLLVRADLNPGEAKTLSALFVSADLSGFA
jgi:endonuclease-3